MIERRALLKLAVGALAGAAGWPGATAALAQPSPEPAAFKPGDVLDMARDLAKRPFRAASSALPDPFGNLAYEQYVAIRPRPEAAIWAAETIGFALEPLHRGFIFSAPVALFVIENGAARRLTYSRAMFDFGKLQPPVDLPDIGFSGFRVLHPNEGGVLLETAIFQGATFFRAVARGQNLGAAARGLSIRTADPRGEEFPVFRAFWIEKPTLAGNALVVHALLDSDSVAGAFRFTLRPGEASIIDIECTLIARTVVDHFGLGAMGAIAYSGALDRRRIDDIRPAVREIGGVQMLNGKNEWLWRPVSNRETLQISAFVDENPRGFGFLQRDRDFAAYQDDDQHWEQRPSIWIEPIGEWGPGQVQLVEIPSDSEVNDNIIAYWRPRAPLLAGVEAPFAYRQFWCWTPPERPGLAIVTTSRAGRAPGPAGGKRRRFLVEFSSDAFADARNMDVRLNLTAGGGSIIAPRTFCYPERKAYRVMFDLDPGSETASELRLALEIGGKAISETWLFRWTA